MNFFRLRARAALKNYDSYAQTPQTDSKKDSRDPSTDDKNIRLDHYVEVDFLCEVGDQSGSLT